MQHGFDHYQQMNDYNRKVGPDFPVRVVIPFEAKRASLRVLVRGYLKYTVRGRRDGGRMCPRTLATIRTARRDHTMWVNAQNNGWAHSPVGLGHRSRIGHQTINDR